MTLPDDVSYSDFISYVAPLFEEAWENRRRRRRQGVLIALLCVAIASLSAALLPRRADRQLGVGPASGHEAVEVPASRVLVRTPYMGVRCRVANSIACDEVGLAVWLRRPAESVSATIDGAPVSLDRYGDLLVNAHPPRRDFDGYLTRAGIVSRMHVIPQSGDIVVRRHGRWDVLGRHRMWYGGGNPSATVRLVIRQSAGHTVLTRVQVPLSDGWG